MQAGDATHGVVDAVIFETAVAQSSVNGVIQDDSDAVITPATP